MGSEMQQRVAVRSKSVSLLEEDSVLSILPSWTPCCVSERDLDDLTPFILGCR